MYHMNTIKITHLFTIMSQLIYERQQFYFLLFHVYPRYAMKLMFASFSPPASEFMLMLDNHDSLLEDDADLSETRLQSLVFRALENDQKSTWRHLLAQRVKACRSQREYCL